jgi:hypothetical protein
VDGGSVGGQPYYCFNTVAAAHTIQAFFASYVKVASVFFGTLQAAYEASGIGAPVKARNVYFNEDLFCNMNKETVISGGFNNLFSAQLGTTVLFGNMEISAGGVEVQNLGFE